MKNEENENNESVMKMKWCRNNNNEKYEIM